MARSDRDKGPRVDKDGKIQKLTRMIKRKERELELVERRIDHAKAQVSKGDMSKGEFKRMQIQLARDRKGVRGAITKLERSRLNRERALKEKHAMKLEKQREREERRRKREEERERRRADREGADED